MKKIKMTLLAIFGLALITGLAAILLSAICKILIVAGILGTIIYLASKRVMRHKQHYGLQGLQHFNNPGFNNRVFQNGFSFNHDNVTPIVKTQSNSGVIPIN